MEAVANSPIPSIPTRSNVSDFIGQADALAQPTLEGVRIGEEKLVCDRLDLSDRLFSFAQCLKSYSLDFDSQDNVSLVFDEVGTLDPLSLFDQTAANPLLTKMMELYAGFAYDSIEVTFTVSDPKGVVGGVFVGYTPTREYAGNNYSEIKTNYSTSNMTKQTLTLSPVCELLPLSMSQEVKFEIPWQFPCSYITRTKKWHTEGTGDHFNGWPVIWWWSPVGNYVTTVTMPPKIRGFIRFKNLRWFSPSRIAPVALLTNKKLQKKTKNFPTGSKVKNVPQSGLEGPAIAMVASAATTGVEILADQILSSVYDFEPAPSNTDTPTTVQPAYVGDSTTFGPPSVKPVFFEGPIDGTKHKIIDFLKRPQYLGKDTVSGTTLRIYADPIYPTGVVTNATHFPVTYFKWFSQGATFWRGTLSAFFVICGHPNIEVSYRTTIIYPDVAYGDADKTVGGSSVTLGTCSGHYVVKVPLPYHTNYDFMPIHDAFKAAEYPTAKWENRFTSCVEFVASVVSTPFDTTPTIPVLMFLGAEEDFMFYQPYAVGMGEQEENGLMNVPQVNLGKPDLVVETRAKLQPPLPSMLPLMYIEDWFNIWSRALPWRALGNADEPDPKVEYAAFPAWCPTNSWTWTSNVNNSWWITNDYVSMFSLPFLLYKGSIGLKVCCDLRDSVDPYRFISLDYADARQKANNPFANKPLQLPSTANFAKGVVCTPAGEQPVLDMTIPYRNPTMWSFTTYEDENSFYSYDNDLSSDGRARLVTNLLLLDPAADYALSDALYRKAGPDFCLAVECVIPSPYLWVAKGGDWA